MLFYPATMKPVRRIPHKSDFARWTAKLTDVEIRAIENEIDRLIDAGLNKGTEVQVAGWMPGADWTDTVWDPIFRKACGKNVTAAGYCFGIFVWKAFMERPDTWSFVGDAVKKDGTPIQSKVYFRIDAPRGQ